MRALLIYLVFALLPVFAWGQETTMVEDVIGVDFDCSDCDLEVEIRPDENTTCGATEFILKTNLEGDYEYYWEEIGNPINNGIEPTFLATSTGEYTVIVTDAQGCEATDSFEGEKIESEIMEAFFKENCFVSIPVNYTNREDGLTVNYENSRSEDIIIELDGLGEIAVSTLFNYIAILQDLSHRYSETCEDFNTNKIDFEAGESFAWAHKIQDDDNETAILYIGVVGVAPENVMELIVDGYYDFWEEFSQDNAGNPPNIDLSLSASCLNLSENIKIKSIRFLDQNIIADGTTLLEAGSRLPVVQWQPLKNPQINSPMTFATHIQTPIQAQLLFEVNGLTGEVPYTLIGKSKENLYNFEKTGILDLSNPKINVVGTNSILKGDIKKIRKRIEWTLTLNGEKHKLGRTGPHIAYMTFKNPIVGFESKVTVPNIPRMDRAIKDFVEAVSKVKAEGGDGTCYQDILHKLIDPSIYPYFTGRNLTDKNAKEPWLYPSLWTEKGAKEYDGMKYLGADCITIATFVNYMGKMMGIPGEIGSKPYIAYYRTPEQPNRPEDALVGSFFTSEENPTVNPGEKGVPLTQGLESEWLLSLIDASCIHPTNPNAPRGSEGCVGGGNRFEAAVVYEIDGENYYYPGGTSLVYNDEDDIVTIMKTLAWLGFGDHDNDSDTPDILLVKKVDFNYTQKPSTNTKCE